MACCLMDLGCVSPPIRQALSANSLQGDFGARCVVIAQLDAVIGAKIELGQVALQVLFTAMLVGPDHAALEH